MKHFTAAILVILNLSSCGRNDDNAATTVQQTPIQTQLGEGVFAINCFLNKLASSGVGIPIYSKSIITLEAVGTGNNNYELYDDSNCTNLLQSGSTIVLHYETIQVNGENVLMMEQDDGFSIMQLWIGYKKVGGNYYLDVNFNDNESGPYLAEPTAAELNQFMLDPLTQGIPLVLL